MGFKERVIRGKFSDAPHVPRLSALLDSPDMIRNPIEVFERYRAELGPTFTFHFGGAKRAVVSTDPEVLEHVLKHGRDKYEKSHIQTQHMVEFQGKGLVNIHGEAWMRQRRLVAQGFKAKRLAELLPLQQDVLAEMMVAFEAEADAGPVDVHKQMVRLTLGLVGKSIFGRAMSDPELQQIAETISVVQSFIIRQIVHPYMIPWFRISGESAKYQELRVQADRLVLEHIRNRRREGTDETDFLRILLELPYHDTGLPMTEEQALIEALQLLVAGNETSSNGLTWMFYLLGRHPEYIEQIRREIDTVIGDGPVDFDGLHRLGLSLEVIYEALRLYPPFWMIDRIAIEDDDVAGVRIPKGTLVLPYIYGTHRNPAIWQDAERFDPSRFDAERRKARHAFGYLPFGGGPRICVGNNMAIAQMLLILVTIVRKWDFEMADDADVGIHPMMLLRPAGEVRLRFHRR